jgi:phosphatidylinositol glycan class M
MKSEFCSLTTLSLILRLLLVFLGNHLDKIEGGPKYTDIDYGIFNDAAMLSLNGYSPYERETFRYPPIIALLLQPNYYFPGFGKVLFVLADVAVVRLVDDIVLQMTGERNLWAPFLWGFNPLSINISTRGSCDSISNLFSLLSLKYLLKGDVSICAVVYGLFIYFRLYPVIYLFGFLAFILLRDGKINSNHKHIYHGAVHLNWQKALQFLTIVYVSFSSAAIISYYFYGQPYLSEAVIYHIFRTDHRHNFSPWFYSIYLSKHDSSATSPSLSSASASALSFSLHSYHDYVSFASIMVMRLGPFLPQIVLMIVLAYKIAPRNIVVWMLVQTYTFVAFNKVITAQYFTWFACLIPIAVFNTTSTASSNDKRSSDSISTLDSISNLTSTSTAKRPSTSLCIMGVSLWSLTLSLWLWRAYLLEFEGVNTFLSIWIAAIAFHVVNVALIIGVITYS